MTLLSSFVLAEKEVWFIKYPQAVMWYQGLSHTESFFFDGQMRFCLPCAALRLRIYCTALCTALFLSWIETVIRQRKRSGVSQTSLGYMHRMHTCFERCDPESARSLFTTLKDDINSWIEST